MAQNVRYPARSFIVRVWGEDSASPQLRGEVESVATGEKRLFLDAWSLLRLIETWQHDLEAVSPGGAPGP
jgi:hypothetical protein